MAAPQQSQARRLRVAMVWNQSIQAEHVLEEPRSVVLGYGDDAMFPLPESHSAAGDTALLVPSADSYVVQVPQGATGALWLSGQRKDVARMASAQGGVVLGPEDYGVISLGAVSIFFQHVRSVPQPKRRLLQLDPDSAAAFGLSLFLHVAFLLLLLLAWREAPPEETLELPTELISRFLVTPPPEDVLEALQRSGDETVDPGMRDRDEGGKARERDEGRVGKEDAKQKQTEIAGDTRNEVATKVRGMGLLGALSGGDALDDALDLPSVGDMLGGLGAVRTVVGKGSGGAGLRGVGSGGGGDAAGGLFGSGKLGTGIGSGKGGRGRGKGGAGARGKPRKEAKVSVKTGKAKVSGFLSAEQINRVVRANRAALRYCYENEVQRNRSLRGQIKVQWRVDRKGRVPSARVIKSTMRNSRVEGCIVRQVRKWRFPKPDGGQVTVVFPFIFGVGG